MHNYNEKEVLVYIVVNNPYLPIIDGADHPSADAFIAENGVFSNGELTNSARAIFETSSKVTSSSKEEFCLSKCAPVWSIFPSVLASGWDPEQISDPRWNYNFSEGQGCPCDVTDGMTTRRKREVIKSYRVGSKLRVNISNFDLGLQRSARREPGLVLLGRIGISRRGMRKREYRVFRKQRVLFLKPTKMEILSLVAKIVDVDQNVEPKVFKCNYVQKMDFTPEMNVPETVLPDILVVTPWHVFKIFLCLVPFAIFCGCLYAKAEQDRRYREEEVLYLPHVKPEMAKVDSRKFCYNSMMLQSWLRTARYQRRVYVQEDYTYSGKVFREMYMNTDRMRLINTSIMSYFHELDAPLLASSFYVDREHISTQWRMNIDLPYHIQKFKFHNEYEKQAEMMMFYALMEEDPDVETACEQSVEHELWKRYDSIENTVSISDAFDRCGDSELSITEYMQEIACPSYVSVALKNFDEAPACFNRVKYAAGQVQMVAMRASSFRSELVVRMALLREAEEHFTCTCRNHVSCDYCMSVSMVVKFVAGEKIRKRYAGPNLVSLGRIEDFVKRVERNRLLDRRALVSSVLRATKDRHISGSWVFDDVSNPDVIGVIDVAVVLTEVATALVESKVDKVLLDKIHAVRRDCLKKKQFDICRKLTNVIKQLKMLLIKPEMDYVAEKIVNGVTGALDKKIPKSFEFDIGERASEAVDKLTNSFTEGTSMMSCFMNKMTEQGVGVNLNSIPIEVKHSVAGGLGDFFAKINDVITKIHEGLSEHKVKIAVVVCILACLGMYYTENRMVQISLALVQVAIMASVYTDDVKESFLSMIEEAAARSPNALYDDVPIMFARAEMDGIEESKAEVVLDVLPPMAEQVDKVKVSWMPEIQEGIGVSIVTMLYLVTIGKACSTKDAFKMFKTFGDMSKIKAGIDYTIEFVIKLMSKFFKWVGRINENPELEHLLDPNPEFTQLEAKVHEFIREVNKGVKKVNYLNGQELYKLEGEVARLVESISPTQRDVADYRRNALGLQAKLKQVLVMFAADGVKRGIRPRPCGVWIYGESQVGKSSSIRHMIAHTSSHMMGEKEFDMFCEDPNGSIYAFNPERDHYDGYGGEYHCVVDEALVMKDGGIEKSGVSCLIRMISNFDYPLPMAALERKANTSFTSKIVWAMSNVLYVPGAVSTLNYVMALINRFDVAIAHCVVKEYATLATRELAVDKRQLDYTKLPQGCYFPDGIDGDIIGPGGTLFTDCYEYHFVDLWAGVVRAGNPYTWRMMADHIVLVAKRLRDRNTTITESFKGSINMFREERRLRLAKGLRADAIPYTPGAAAEMDDVNWEMTQAELHEMYRDQAASHSPNPNYDPDSMWAGVSRRLYPRELISYLADRFELNMEYLAEYLGATPDMVGDTPVKVVMECINRKVGGLVKTLADFNAKYDVAGKALIAVGLLGTLAIGWHFCKDFFVRAESGKVRHTKTQRRNFSKAKVFQAMKLSPEAVAYSNEFDPIVTKIFKGSVYELRILGDDKILSRLMFIKNKTALWLQHYTDTLDAADASVYNEDGVMVRSNGIVIELTNISKPTQKIKISWQDLSDEIRMCGTDDNELRFAEFKHSEINHPDLVRHLPRRLDLRFVQHEKFSGCLLKPVDKLYKVWPGDVLSLGAIKYPHDYIDQFGVAKSKDVVNESGFSYNFTHGVGFCGLPLLTCDSKWTHPVLLGIHCAGGLGTGYAVRVNRETVEGYFHTYSELDIQCDFPENWNISDPVVGSQFSVLAETEPYHVNVKSKLTESILYGDLAAIGHPSTKLPAQLRTGVKDGVEIDVMGNRRRKYGLNDVAINHHTWKVCKESFINRVLKYSAESPLGGPRLLTDVENVLGIPGIYQGFTFGTSPGYPFCNQTNKPGKREWFNDKDGNPTIDTPKAREFFKDCKVKEAMGRRGERALYLYFDLLKDELRSEGKEWTPRGVAGCPMDLLYMIRKYCGAFIIWFFYNRLSNGSAIGINPHSAEWGVLMRLLKTAGLNFMDGDYAGFDENQRMFEINVTLDLMEAFYHNATPEERMMRRMLMMEIYNSRHVSRIEFKKEEPLPSDICLSEPTESGVRTFVVKVIVFKVIVIGDKKYIFVIYERYGPLPSGCPLTTICNCNTNNVNARYCFVTEQYGDNHVFRIGMPSNLEHFESGVYMCTFGDDLVASVSDPLKEYFNQGVMERNMPYLGLKYTDADKQTGRNEWKTEHNLQFLKRAWKFMPKIGRYVSVLEKQIMYNMLAWTMKLEKPGAMSAMCNEFVKEMSPNGERVWVDEVEPVIAIMDKYGVCGMDMPRSWETALMACVSQKDAFHA